MVEIVKQSDSARGEAMALYGGPAELKKLDKLQLTVTKVGDPKIKGEYVTGILGFAPDAKKIELPIVPEPKKGVKTDPYTVKKGAQVTIRCDWDQSKGNHVNFAADQAKVAYVEKKYPSYSAYNDELRENNAVTHHTKNEVPWDKTNAVHKRNDAIAVIDNWAARTSKL